MPQKKIKAQINEVHPETDACQNICLRTRKTIETKETPTKSNPSMDANDNGAVENPTTPSNEYLKSFQKDHLVSPATRSTFSNSIHLVRNPTHALIPFEKRLYSFKERTASTTALLISL